MSNKEMRMEQASVQNMCEIVKSIFSIEKEAFLLVLTLLTYGNMPREMNPIAPAMMGGGMSPGAMGPQMQQ
jgi:hypothetical protein